MGTVGRHTKRFATTLLLTLAALCGVSALGMVAHIAQPHAVERCSFIPYLAGDAKGNAGRFGGCDVAFPCYLHSLTSQGWPIDSASQHASSGFAVDLDWLRLIPNPVTYMAFNFLSNAGVSAVAIAVGALVTGCGGGGGVDTETSQSAVVSSDVSTAASGKTSQDAAGLTSSVSQDTGVATASSTTTTQDPTVGSVPSSGVSTTQSTSNETTAHSTGDDDDASEMVAITCAAACAAAMLPFKYGATHGSRPFDA